LSTGKGIAVGRWYADLSDTDLSGVSGVALDASVPTHVIAANAAIAAPTAKSDLPEWLRIDDCALSVVTAPKGLWAQNR
jgi:hypothetical protein